MEILMLLNAAPGEWIEPETPSWASPRRSGNGPSMSRGGWWALDAFRGGRAKARRRTNTADVPVGSGRCMGEAEPKGPAVWSG